MLYMILLWNVRNHPPTEEENDGMEWNEKKERKVKGMEKEQSKLIRLWVWSLGFPEEVSLSLSNLMFLIIIIIISSSANPMIFVICTYDIHTQKHLTFSRFLDYF